MYSYAVNLFLHSIYKMRLFTGHLVTPHVGNKTHNFTNITKKSVIGPASELARLLYADMDRGLNWFTLTKLPNHCFV